MSVSACMHKQMGVCLVCVCIRNNELAALMFANIVFLEIVHPCRWTGIFWYSHHFMLLSLFFSQCFYFGTKSNECVTTLYINFYNLWLNRLWAVVRSTYTWSNWPVASVSMHTQCFSAWTTQNIFHLPNSIHSLCAFTRQFISLSSNAIFYFCAGPNGKLVMAEVFHFKQ